MLSMRVSFAGCSGVQGVGITAGEFIYITKTFILLVSSEVPNPKDMCIFETSLVTLFYAGRWCDDITFHNYLPI